MFPNQFKLYGVTIHLKWARTLDEVWVFSWVHVHIIDHFLSYYNYYYTFQACRSNSINNHDDVYENLPKDINEGLRIQYCKDRYNIRHKVPVPETIMSEKKHIVLFRLKCRAKPARRTSVSTLQALSDTHSIHLGATP